MNNFTYVLSHIRHIRQNVVVLKIERYGTGLTQGYNTDGSFGLWAPEGINYQCKSSLLSVPGNQLKVEFYTLSESAKDLRYFS